MSTTLILCRHGETDWNHEGRIMGIRDIPLNESGRAQARALGERLCRYPVAAVVASDLARTRETAGLAFPGLPLSLDPRLREADFGRATGLTRAQYRQFEGGRWWRAIVADPDNAPHPGGEAFGAVRDRMLAAIRATQSEIRGACIAIVSHGSALEVGLAGLLQQSLTEAPRFHLQNGQCWVVHETDGRWALAGGAHVQRP